MNTSTLALTELLLKGTAVLLAGYGATQWLGRASAAQRSLCWLGVFATMLFLPLALVVRPAWSLPVELARRPAAPPAQGAPISAETPAPVAQASVPPSSLAAWLAVIYGGGVCTVLGFRLLGAAQLWRLHRAVVPHAPGQAIVDGWRAELRLRRPVQVATSACVTVPMTCGTWRPVILLPTAPLGDAELEAALQHEFTHIRHGDSARRWLGTIVTALWWPHPLIWTAFRSWKLEQERACDDAVLNHGADAADYAQQLLDAARQARLSRAASAGALVMAVPSGLETRLRSVTNVETNRAPARLASLWPIGAMAIAATLCGLAFQAQSVTAAPPAAKPDAEVKALQHKAETAIIPKLVVREATVTEMIKEVTGQTGIKIVYEPKKENEARITIQLTNVPASDALRYMTSLSNTVFTYKKDGVYIRDLAPGEALPVEAPKVVRAVDYVTREWKIPPNFPVTVPKKAEPRSASEDLAAAGIVFPPASMAQYSKDRSRLFVRNTKASLDLIDALVELSEKKQGAPTGR